MTKKIDYKTGSSFAKCLQECDSNYNSLFEANKKTLVEANKQFMRMLAVALIACRKLSKKEKELFWKEVGKTCSKQRVKDLRAFSQTRAKSIKLDGEKPEIDDVVNTLKKKGVTTYKSMKKFGAKTKTKNTIAVIVPLNCKTLVNNIMETIKTDKNQSLLVENVNLDDIKNSLTSVLLPYVFNDGDPLERDTKPVKVTRKIGKNTVARPVTNLGPLQAKINAGIVPDNSAERLRQNI